ncbi:glycosyl transferase [Jannaschia sp. W003]|uniref:glycosyl transferase n=1 Tax=Jannaschia sp. W003 TaxID=2867012 RepID=UPI0021A30EFC|nr:glycosyl transferase [Jannaschia sp. W003]UWQ21591.1 glycosyl transferase [Jannaschia sp. W003]
MRGDPPAAGRVAYFGHNVGDAAVRRRVDALRRAGYEVLGLMPRRAGAAAPDWPHVDLGETRDNAYAARLAAIASGSRRAMEAADALRACDVILARNIDMLAMAHRVRRRLGLRVPVIYECLDIHYRLSGQGASGALLRLWERRLLRRTAATLISSPRFASEHFDRHHPGLAPPVLMENRLIEGGAFGPRPGAGAGDAPRPGGPLRLGWFGNLRCRRSLDLLKGLAAAFPRAVQVELRGYPAPGVFSDFEAELRPHPNIRFHGRYRAPEELGAIYAGIDLIWAGDWYEAGANSLWLLPNRIYEGGYFATPAIAPEGTETARWLRGTGGAFLLEGPVEPALHRLVADLVADPGPIAARRAALAALPRDRFVEGPEVIAALIEGARAGTPAP